MNPFLFCRVGGGGVSLGIFLCDFGKGRFSLCLSFQLGLSDRIQFLICLKGKKQQ